MLPKHGFIYDLFGFKAVRHRRNNSMVCCCKRKVVHPGWVGACEHAVHYHAHCPSVILHMLAVACVALELVDQLWRAIAYRAVELHFCSSTERRRQVQVGEQLVSAASSVCSIPQQAPNMCTKEDLHTKWKQKPDVDKKESRSRYQKEWQVGLAKCIILQNQYGVI